MIPIPSVPIMLLAFALALGPLIFFHELGHYLAGRLFGVHSEAFSIGFGHEIAGWSDRRGTRWKLGWIPLGGYVRFAGDMNPASQPSADWLALPTEQRGRTFQAKPLWQRAIIAGAGPATNFLIAVLIFAGFFAAFGEPRTPNVVREVAAGSPAAVAGVRPGDRITMIARTSVGRFEDVAQAVQMYPGQPVRMDVYRKAVDGRERQLRLLVTPERVVMTRDRFGNEEAIGRIGVSGGAPVYMPLPLVEVPSAALRHTGIVLTAMAQGLGEIVLGQRSVAELGGPVKIAQFAGQTLELGWLRFIEFVALISLNLGFINLLPIPLLDGGHLMFYAIEAVRRRPFTPAVQEWAFRIGLAILLPFIIFVTFNDFGVWRGIAGLIG